MNLPTASNPKLVRRKAAVLRLGLRLGQHVRVGQHVWSGQLVTMEVGGP